MHVKELVKVAFSKGGGVQLDLFLTGEGGRVLMNVIAKKNIVLACES